MASAESALFPTYEPLMVIILMTDSKTGARRYAPAGRPMAITVPRGRTYWGYQLQIHTGIVGNGTYLSSLLEWLLVNSDQDDSVWSKAISSSSLDIADDVLAGQEVNKGLSTKLGSHLLLLVTTIDGDDSETHCLSILAGKRSKPTTSTDNSDGLAWPGS